MAPPHRTPAPKSLTCATAHRRGQPAEGGNASPSAFLQKLFRGLSRQARAGVRAAAIDRTSDEPRAPKPSENKPETFHCPVWPGCGCPGGVVHPDCPGLKERNL